MLRSAARRSFALPTALALLLLVLAPVGAADPPKIYKWVDSNGIAHYTVDPDRIPKALRNRIESVVRESAAPSPEPQPARTDSAFTAPADSASAAPGANLEPGTTAPRRPPAAPEPALVEPSQATAAPAPAATAVGLPSDATVRSGDDWFEHDVLPPASDASLLSSGEASPARLDALAAQQEALDARIAELQTEINRDENFLKGLISDPDLDADVPLFDRPEFLEVSRRLPKLQEQLQELRDERAQLGTP